MNNHWYNEGKQILHKDIRKERKENSFQGRTKKQAEKNYKLIGYTFFTAILVTIIFLILKLFSWATT